MAAKGVSYLRDVRTEHLTEFQQMWKGRRVNDPKTGEKIHLPKSQHGRAKYQEYVKTFFKRSRLLGWITVNPAELLETIRTEDAEIKVYAAAEKKKILDAIPQTFPKKAAMVRAFLLVQRFSALRISDMASLEVESLKDDGIMVKAQRFRGTRVGAGCDCGVFGFCCCVLWLHRRSSLQRNRCSLLKTDPASKGRVLLRVQRHYTFRLRRAANIKPMKPLQVINMVAGSGVFTIEGAEVNRALMVVPSEPLKSNPPALHEAEMETVIGPALLTPLPTILTGSSQVTVLPATVQVAWFEVTGGTDPAIPVPVTAEVKEPMLSPVMVYEKTNVSTPTAPNCQSFLKDS
jgi:hypothetical protein